MMKNVSGKLQYLEMMIGGLEVSGLLDTDATRTFLSSNLLSQIPADQIRMHAAADPL